MLSIIICSRSKVLDEDFQNNIKSTVGCDFEIMVIDNSKTEYSIFEAYNIGINNTKGEYLCFIHDDIRFRSNDWGIITQDLLNSKTNIGVVGLAGSKIKTKTPSSWSDCEPSHAVINVIQHLDRNVVKRMEVGFNNNDFEEVITIDGVFMATKRSRGIHFNTKMFGFHNYDLSFSLDHKIKGFINIVTNKILIEHFSIGTINKSWYKSALMVDSIYGKYLPLATHEFINSKSLKNRELSNSAALIIKLFEFGFHNKALKYWIKLFFIKPHSIYHFILLKRILNFKKPDK